MAHRFVIADMAFAIGFTVVSVSLADAFWLEYRYGSKATLYAEGLVVSLTFSLTSIIEMLFDTVPFSVEKAAASPL